VESKQIDKTYVCGKLLSIISMFFWSIEYFSDILKIFFLQNIKFR